MRCRIALLGLLNPRTSYRCSGRCLPSDFSSLARLRLRRGSTVARLAPNWRRVTSGRRAVHRRGDGGAERRDDRWRSARLARLSGVAAAATTSPVLRLPPVAVSGAWLRCLAVHCLVERPREPPQRVREFGSAAAPGWRARVAGLHCNRLHRVPASDDPMEHPAPGGASGGCRGSRGLAVGEP